MHVFKSCAYEFQSLVKGGMYTVIGFVTALVHYKHPTISLLAFLFWQASPPSCTHRDPA